MWEYTKYYLAPLTQALAILGFYVGGNYVWIGVAFLPAMAIVDSLLPLDLRPRKMRNGTPNVGRRSWLGWGPRHRLSTTPWVSASIVGLIVWRVPALH